MINCTILINYFLIYNEGFHIFFPSQNITRVIKIKENEMNRLCSKHEDTRMSKEMYSENLKGRYDMRDQDADGKVILKLI
jgi:hypothetical protein